MNCAACRARVERAVSQVSGVTSCAVNLLTESMTVEGPATDDDIIAAVLAAGLVERVTSWQVDGFAGLAVAVFILYSGCRLAKDTVSPLLGEATDPQLRGKLTDFVESNPGRIKK